MGITQVPAYVPPDTSSRLAALESADAVQTFMTNAKGLVSSGGVLGVDAAYNVWWTYRFVVMAAGMSPTLCPSGFFDIAMPPNGTVIPRVGATAASSVTVASNAINLNPWDAIYYILPLGSASTSLPGNFRIVQYTANLTIPVNWMPIAIRNSEGTGAIGCPDSIHWCNGVNQSARVLPTPTTPFTNYGAPWAVACYYKINTRVYLEGLISLNGGAPGATIFTLPPTFRPGQDTHSTAHAAAAHGAVNVYRDGRVVYNCGPTYVSLDEVSHQAVN